MPEIVIAFWKLFFFFFGKQALAFGLTTKMLMIISGEIFKIFDVTDEQQKRRGEDSSWFLAAWI